MLYQSNPADVDTESAGLISDLASTQTKSALQGLPIGEKSVFTDFTFPTARIGIEFYAKSPGALKDQIIGEMEKSALKVDTIFQDIVNKMGDGAGLGAALRENITKAVTDVRLMGLDFKDIQSTAVATLDTFGRNVSLTDEEYKNILATQQVTGVENKKLIEGFANAGMSIKDITSEMDTVLNVANAIGVNAKTVSGKVVENLDKLNKFGFQNGIEGLAKMAAKAQILRIDMKEIFTLADTLMDPEGAIDLASNLQRLGATSSALTDPLRLMDMAQNDVGALTDELGKMFSQYAEFSEENQRFEILPNARREIKQLEKDLNLPAGTIEKMAIGTKDLEKKLSEISFSGFDIPQETQELIANMSMMGEDGEYRIKYVDEEGKAREETTAEFLDKFGSDVEAMKTALGKQKEIEGETIEQKMFRKAEEQLTALEAIKANTLASTGALGLSMGGGEFGKNFLEMQREAAKTTNQAIIDNLGPKGPIFQEYQNLAKNTKDAFDILTGKKEGNKAEAGIDVGKQMLEVVTTTMTSVFQTGKDILKGSLENVGVDMGTIKIDALSALTNFNLDELKTSAQELAKDGFNELKSKAASLGIDFDAIGQKFKLTSQSQTQGTQVNVPTNGSTTSITPTQSTVGNEPTPLQQVNEITTLPIQNTAENLLAPEVQDATEKGMSEALSYYSASPAFKVVIIENRAEQKGIEVPKKSEETTGAVNVNIPSTQENTSGISSPEITVSYEEQILKINELKSEIEKYATNVSAINSTQLIDKETKESKIESLTKETIGVVQPILNEIKGYILQTNVTNTSNTTGLDLTKLLPQTILPLLGESNYFEEVRSLVTNFVQQSSEATLDNQTLYNQTNRALQQNSTDYSTNSNINVVNPNVENTEISKQGTIVNLSDEQLETLNNLYLALQDSQDIMKIGVDKIMSNTGLSDEEKKSEIETFKNTFTTNIMQPMISQIQNLTNMGDMSTTSSMQKYAQTVSDVTTLTQDINNGVNEITESTSGINNSVSDITNIAKDVKTDVSNNQTTADEISNTLSNNETATSSTISVNNQSQNVDSREELVKLVQSTASLVENTKTLIYDIKKNKELTPEEQSEQIRDVIVKSSEQMSSIREQYSKISQEEIGTTSLLSGLKDIDFESMVSNLSILKGDKSVVEAGQVVINPAQEVPESKINPKEGVTTPETQSREVINSGQEITENKIKGTTNEETGNLSTIEPQPVVGEGTVLNPEFEGTETQSVVGKGTVLRPEFESTEVQSVKTKKSTSEIVKELAERAQKLVEKYNQQTSIKENTAEEKINVDEIAANTDLSQDDLSALSKNPFNTPPSQLGEYVAKGDVFSSPSTNVLKPEFTDLTIGENSGLDVGLTTAIGQGTKLFNAPPSQLGTYVAKGVEPTTTNATVVNPGIPKPNSEEETAINPNQTITETDFGFGAEVPTSVAEFKGNEDVVNQFLNPEAIAASPTPIAQTYDERLQQLQSTTMTNNQTNTIGGTARVEVVITGSKDPQTERELRKAIIDTVNNEMTINNGFQRNLNQASSDKMANFGLMS